MVVSEGAINNIMGGMENTAGVRLHSHRHKLKQRFDILRKLGQGTYGKVQLAVNKETGQEVAIKTIKKAKIETEQDLIRIRREIQIMSSVQHPQIIHIYEVFENREKMVLVMEYAAGGELYDYLSERKVLSEDEARRVFRHVASATYYCHKHKICHRDLKLENILLDLDGNAKIADFGLSNVFDEKHRLDTFCGSPLYASPEIVKGIPYIGPEVDCWSLGVLLYTLVYGAMPFDGSNFKRLVKQITQGDYYEPKKPSRASELIRHMLTVSASKRATVEEICSHWWVNEGFTEPCLEVAEALANQTPVRLDLLLSLAPKHINSEHMLIQPEEDDNSARSPPNSEAARPPPNLKLPPPPPADAPIPVGPARSASLGAIDSVSTNEIEALVAQKMQKRKEEEEEGEDERKRKAADESGTVERRKKKRDASDGSLRVGRKEQKRSEEGGSGTRRAPGSSESESAERKKISRRKEAAESEEQEKAEQRKNAEKKRESLFADGEANDVNERSERRKSTRKVEKADGEKAEKKKTVKKRESGIERDASEGDDRTEGKKSAKKRDSEVTPDSSVERKTSRKRDISGDDLSGRDDTESAYVSSSVINGEVEDVGEEEEMGERKESGIGLGGSSKEAVELDQSPSSRESRGSTEGKVRLGNLQESSVEVKEKIKKSPGRSQSGESRRVTKGTTKASSSRESVSPIKQPKGTSSPPTSTTTTTTITTTTTAATTATTTTGAAGAATTSTVAAQSSQGSPQKKPSPPPSQPPKVRKTDSKSLIQTASGVQGEAWPAESVAAGSRGANRVVKASQPASQEKALQDATDKIKCEEKEEVKEPRTPDSAQPTGRPEMSKGSGQPSSVPSTPSRSRDGSESSGEAAPRPPRPDGARRQSKVFKAAALWENDRPSNTSSAQPDKLKKPVRTGGSVMSDLTKKFEVKPSVERRSKVVPSLKVSDAKKAFEVKPAEKPTITMRKKSTAETLPTSPTSAKDTPAAAPTKEPTTGKSPARENSSPVKDSLKEAEKLREKSPRVGKETPARVPSKTKMEPEAEKRKLEDPAKKEKQEVTKKTPLTTAPATEKPTKAEERTMTSRPPEASRKSTTVKEEKTPAAETELKQIIRQRESSESSESESEAERLLKVLSEKREKVEAAKQEKLRKVSGTATKAPQADIISKEPQPKSPSKLSPTKSPTKLSPNKSPEKPLPTPDARETGPEQKFATLPRGFKTKGAANVTSPTTTSQAPLTSPADRPKKDRVNQEIEGMMSAIKAVDKAITKEEEEIKMLRDSLAQRRPEEGVNKGREEQVKPSVKDQAETLVEEEEKEDKKEEKTAEKHVQKVEKEERKVEKQAKEEKEELDEEEEEDEDEEEEEEEEEEKEEEDEEEEAEEEEEEEEEEDEIEERVPERIGNRALRSKEIIPVPPEQVLSCSIQDRPASTTIIIKQGPSESPQKTTEVPELDRKKTKLEIVLNNKQPAQQQPEAKRASYAEIKLSSPSTKEPPRVPGFRTEVCAKVEAVPLEPVTGPVPGPVPGPGPGPGPGEAQLQRAKRERIIPIMLEDDDEDDDTTASESHIPLDSSRRLGSSMSCSSARITPLTSQLTNSRLPDPRTPPVCTPAPEPIRKSPRERIIPIAVEGEGLVTPPPHMEEGAGLGAARAHQAFSRTLSGRPNTINRGRGFMLDHSESFSSAGEEEEEDEDDGFQILTAESLFSTLLNRVRSLTRKMNAEDGRGDRVRLMSNRPTPDPSGAAGMPGAVHSGSAGFWSSLYNSPRDSPARRISDTMSHSSLGRDEDGMAGLGSPLWTRSVSRDPSDADTLFSEASSSAQFGTLPRGTQ